MCYRNDLRQCRKFSVHNFAVIRAFSKKAEFASPVIICSINTNLGKLELINKHKKTKTV